MKTRPTFSLLPKLSLFLGGILLVTGIWKWASPHSPNPIYEWQIEGKADDNFNEAQLRLWLPPQIKPKGILVVLQGSGMCGLHLADDPGWQRLASELDYALLAYYLTESSNGKLFHHAEQGSGQALIEGLTHLAQDSGHEEWDTLPLALAGFSVGGQFSYHFSQWRPDRTSAFITMKGGYHRMPNPETSQVPGLLIRGEKDADFRVENLADVYREGQKAQAPWQLVTEPGTGHACENASKLIAPFLREHLSASATGQPGSGFQDAVQSFLENPAGCPLPQMNFESIHPPPLAFSSTAQLDFGPVPWNQGSAWKTLEIQPQNTPPGYDHILARSLEGRAEVKQEEGQRFSLRILPQEHQTLGSFHDEMVLTFEKGGTKQLGSLRIPVFFKARGDVEISPSFVWSSVQALQAGQALQFEVKSKAELEFLGLESSLGSAQSTWKELAPGKYRLTCVLQSPAKPASAKQSLKLAFKQKGEQVDYTLSVFLK